MKNDCCARRPDGDEVVIHARLRQRW